MKQNIIKKLNELKLSCPSDISCEEIDYLIHILEHDEEKDILDFIEFFSEIEKIFKLGHFTEMEKGYCFSLLIQHNYWVTTEKNDHFVRPKLYTKEFAKKGVLDFEVMPLYESYLKHNTIFQPQVSYIDLGKSYLDNIFFCDPDYPSEKVSLFIKYCDINGYAILTPNIFRLFSIPLNMKSNPYYCDMYLFREIGKYLNTSFIMGSKDIFIFEPLQHFLSEILAIPKSLAKDFILSYLKDTSLSNYWPKVKKEILDFIELTFENDTKDFQKYVFYYSQIGEYLGKHPKTTEDYQKYSELLKKKFPIGLIRAYLSYLRTVEPEVKVENCKTKKEFRKELNELFQKEKFNYDDYFKVLEILKNLNYADSINEDILGQMNRLAIQNQSYFVYLYTKAKALNPDLGVLKEIDLVMEEIKTCDNEEDFKVWKNYLDSLFQELLDYGATNFDYDLALIHQN